MRGGPRVRRWTCWKKYILRLAWISLRRWLRRGRSGLLWLGRFTCDHACILKNPEQSNRITLKYRVITLVAFLPTLFKSSEDKILAHLFPLLLVNRIAQLYYFILKNYLWTQNNNSVQIAGLAIHLLFNS